MKPIFHLPRLAGVGLWLALVSSALALGQPEYIETQPSAGSFPLYVNGKVATVMVSIKDFPGVSRAAQDLGKDLSRVTGHTPIILGAGDLIGAMTGTNVVLIGTLGRSPLIDHLVAEKHLDVSAIAGQWEAYQVQVVPAPFPGIAQALVICGSDKRGTIYGIYDVSEQIGVSPWYFWADVPPVKHDALYVKAGVFVQGPPAVKYRGIFLNDEAPSLSGWSHEKFGGFNHACYTNVFELLLRLKANYLWPAMWDNAFDTDDPLNPKLADEYGIVMGTSHHEPMMRSWQEWKQEGHPQGSWDYARNAAALRDYWTAGIRRTRPYENLITIGMRGDGDEPMSEKESVSLLGKIVTDQRKIIATELATNVATVPQVWALYKEVQGYYERGMRVPDDVTLLWCDDNWGNVRRLPTAAERQRAGGAGIYYHMDYVGGPRNYKWLNTVPLPKVWEQMNLAHAYGANRLWIVNVGDLKPLEVPLEFFLNFAWNPDRWPKERLNDYLQAWAWREFGPEHAIEIADLVARYTKYNGWRKPELLEPGTFSLTNYAEADRVLAGWRDLVARTATVEGQLPPDKRAAFFELVAYPVRACAAVNELYIAVAKNRTYAAAGDPAANEYAAQARHWFQADAELADQYNHQLAGGKWNHMMDQTHIGYTGWQQPPSNAMPAVVEVTNATGKFTVAPTSAKLAAAPAGWRGFVEADGYVAMEAAHFTGRTNTPLARWEEMPDLGRTLSAMTIFPQTAPSVEAGAGSPRLDYAVYLSSPGAMTATLVLSPSLNFAPDRGVRIAVAMDEAAPQVLTIVPPGYVAGDGNRDWEETVKDGARLVKCAQTVARPGAHTFHVWMVDPGVALQRIVLDCGGMRPSYLGPPESARSSGL